MISTLYINVGSSDDDINVGGKRFGNTSSSLYSRIYFSYSNATMLHQQRPEINDETWKRGPLLLFTLFLMINIGDGYSQKPHLGDGLQLRLPGFHVGHLGVSSIDRVEDWLSRQSTSQLFQDPSTLPKVIQPVIALNDNNLQIELCDNLQQLLQVYFRRFKIEGVNESWRNFADVTLTNDLATHFGITVLELLDDIYSYVFLRIEKSHDNQTLVENIVLSDKKAKELDEPNSIEAELNHPTHYIKSYATGNSLYQVLVYDKEVYNSIKMDIEDNGSAAYSNTVQGLFYGPSYVVRVGKMRTASRNETVENWANENLRFSYLTANYLLKRHNVHKRFYSSLMKFHRNATLFNQLDELLQDEVLLQLEISSVTHLMPEFADDA